ncbi:MAG: histidine kinase [Saprospiraceae bacterium]|nr:histidine kinase [Saprospiraceae bacterium]
MPKIIVVDDEEDQEELILQKFGNKPFLKGYDFIFARNGLEALQKIIDEPEIDIALLDINMPEMDGLTLLAKIKEINPFLQSILLSAYGDMSNIRTAMNRGAFDFLTKPLDLADLELTLIKTIVEVNRIKENIQIQYDNLLLKQKASDLEMQALRAQMNPHFIFNSLNSINNFILRNEKQQASDYLVKFSKLIRLILENSALHVVSLAQELDTLRLYIELESLRFQHSFNYQLIISDDLDTLSIKVPPLILQPFVENAIHHGLLPKERPGHLKIIIAEEENRLMLSIEDDGIGRYNSSLLSSHMILKHKPMGMKVTRERIKLLGLDRPEGARIETHDLTDSEGRSSGTEIMINIPLNL